MNEGVNPETMLEGVKRYAGWVSAMGNSGTQFVKQAVTFFGPDRHFEESWEVPAVSAARREDPYFKASYDNVDYSQIRQDSGVIMSLLNEVQKFIEAHPVYFRRHCGCFCRLLTAARSAVSKQVTSEWACGSPL